MIDTTSNYLCSFFFFFFFLWIRFFTFFTFFTIHSQFNSHTPIDEIRCMAWPKLVGLHDRLFPQQQKEEANPSPTAAKAQENHKTAFLATASPRTSNRPVLHLPSPPLPSNNNDDHSQASSSKSSGNLSTRDRILAVCDDFEQIERDVARCTWHLLNGNQRQVALQMEHKRHNPRVRRWIQRKQRRLANLINLTLQQSYPLVSPKLRYYQGYHDVACVLLATLGGMSTTTTTSSSSRTTSTSSTTVDHMACTMGLELPASVLLQITQSHLADFCKSSFASLQTALKISIFPLLWACDKPLHDHLQQAELEPFFLLSWVLTWFSHEIRDTELVKRLFDAFLVGHALLPLYTAVAMMLHPYNRQEVLACECDFSLLHQTLQALPRNSSMVGWKYRPGDGYVSDHDDDDDESDDDDDDDIVALENQLLHSDDLAFLKKQRSQNETTPEAMSMESSLVGSSLVGAAKVPFQELLDHALLLMQRIPPSQLVPLATQYYGPAQVEDYMAAAAHNIHLLEPTPVEWAVSPSTPADWVLQQRARGDGHKPTRRERKKEQELKQKYPHASTDTSTIMDAVDDDSVVDEESIRQYLKQNTHTRSVIALGYGRPKKPRFTKKQQKQLLGVAAAVAVSVIAVVWGASGETRMVVPVVVVPRDETIRSRDSFSNDRQTTQQRQSKERAVNSRTESWDLDDLPELTDMGVESEDTPPTVPTTTRQERRV